jgi:hypothetical protein
MYAVYDRIFGDFPDKYTVISPYIYWVLANPRHNWNFPAAMYKTLAIIGTTLAINGNFLRQCTKP